MKPGAKGHHRIEHDDDIVASRLILVPGRPHHDALAHTLGPVVLLPGVRPFVLAPLRDSEFADLTHPAQMPEGTADLFNRVGTKVSRGNKGADRKRPRKIHGQVVTVGFLGERLLDGDAFVESNARKQLRDRLDRFGLDFHRQLDPGIWGSVVGLLRHNATPLLSPTLRTATWPVT